jgi:hypothetical protein
VTYCTDFASASRGGEVSPGWSDTPGPFTGDSGSHVSVWEKTA